MQILEKPLKMFKNIETLNLQQQEKEKTIQYQNLKEIPKNENPKKVANIFQKIGNSIEQQKGRELKY